jgi:gluconate:H+ symporter, GntP family
MNPLWILLIGMVVVVGGVSLLRLHAFLALILAAMVVAALTPPAVLQQFSLRDADKRFQLISANGETKELTLKAAKTLPMPGAPLVVLRQQADGAIRRIATLRVNEVRGQTVLATVTERKDPGEGTGGTASIAVQATDIIVEPAQESAARSLAAQPIGSRIADGFAYTARDLAILIAMASIIGQTLLTSGAAERIVAACRRGLGDRHVPLAFLASGYILAIPLFTVFYLLIPLAKVMRVRSGRDYLLYVLAIVAGATMTHSLVPPAPGALFVAKTLDVKLAMMIPAGLIAGWPMPSGRTAAGRSRCASRRARRTGRRATWWTARRPACRRSGSRCCRSSCRSC